MNEKKELSVNGIEVSSNEILNQIRKQGLLGNIIKGYIIDKELEELEISIEREEQLLEKYMLERTQMMILRLK